MKSKVKRNVYISIISIVLAAFLFGCTNSNAPTPSEITESTGSSTEQTKVAAKKPINVIYSSAYSAGTQWKEKSGLYDSEINWLGFPENELSTKIQLEMFSGAKTFDAAITPAGGAKMYGSMGLLAELEPQDDDVFEGVRKQYMLGDKVYGYSVMTDINILIYNTEHFASAGYTEPPKTWDNYRNMAKHLTVDTNGVRGDEPGFDPNNIAVYGTMFKGAAVDANPWEFACYLYGNGGQYIINDYTNNTYEVACNQPVFVNTLKRLYDMIYVDHSIPKGCINYNYNEFDAMFMEGKVAMCITWPGRYAKYKGTDSVVSKSVGVGVMPSGTASNASPLGGWSIGVFKDSSNLEAAKEFVKALTSKDGLRVYCELIERTPPRASLMQEMVDEANKSNDTDTAKFLEVVLADLSTGQGMDLALTNAASADAQKTASAKLNAVIAGQIDAQKAMDELKVELEEVLASHNYMKE